MISVRHDSHGETALVDTLRHRISIFMERVMMINLTRCQNQSQICSKQWYELDDQEQEALISLRDVRNFNMRQNRDDSTQKAEAVQVAQKNLSMS